MLQNISPNSITPTLLESYNKKVYRVEEVDYDHTPKDKFTLQEKSTKRELTYIDYYPPHPYPYYKEKYNVEIKDPDQPLLVHMNERTNNKIFLIPETCTPSTNSKISPPKTPIFLQRILRIKHYQYRDLGI